MSLDRVTCAEVEASVFTYRGIPIGRYLGGYDETEVDDLLDKVADTLAVDQRARDEIRHACKNAAQRGKTIGERALALTVLGILSDNHADAIVDVAS